MTQFQRGCSTVQLAVAVTVKLKALVGAVGFLLLVSVVAAHLGS